MARKSIPKKLRTILKEKHAGKCGYCGTPLMDKFHIDHIEPFHDGGKCEDENLMAVCISCNLQKGGRTLECFRELIEDKLNQLMLVTNYTVAKRYAMIEETPKKIIFEFERVEDE